MVVTFYLTPGYGEPGGLMTMLDLTGFKATVEVSRQVVRASFDLGKPENVSLALFVREIEA